MEEIIQWITLWNDSEPTIQNLKNFLSSKGFSNHDIDKVIKQHNLIEHYSVL